MQLVFIDESGYQSNWKETYDKQPYFVMSAVCLPADNISSGYDEIRRSIGRIPFPSNDLLPLGRGFELKAKSIAQGGGWWGKNGDAREAVREIFLSSPTKFDGIAIVVVVDKEAHFKKYRDPIDPLTLSLRYIFERIEWYLRRFDDQCICIYDQNKKEDDHLYRQVAEMTAGGSVVQYFSSYYYQMIKYIHTIDRILELEMGNSKNSIGLQIADYFATMAYQYFKQSCPKPCDWWLMLTSQLDRKEGDSKGKLLGYGLKLFPEEAFSFVEPGYY